MVVRSVEGEDLNAIDPGVIRAPDGTLWICYGSYHGNIQLVQLNPKTGLRISPHSKVSMIASHSEASDIIFHDGYYYLFVNHGSCCQGKNSSYNIRVGRSKKVTGPYLDKHGDSLAKGFGSLFLAAEGKKIGPGHFGRLIENGVEKFSCHYEADLDNSGRPTLGFRPLLWTPDGWPVAGSNLPEGIYQLRSQQTEHILEAHTAEARYLTLNNQKWTIAPAGGGFHTITNAASGNALQIVPADGSLEFAAFTGSDSQLWKLDQFPDGSYRIASKAGNLALSLVGTKDRPNAVTAAKFTGGDAQKWTIVEP